MLKKKKQFLNNRIRRFLDSECFLKYLKPASEYYNPKKKPNTRPTLGLNKYPPYTWFKYPPRDQLWADLFVAFVVIKVKYVLLICFELQFYACLE
jgi:hypothetical protein